ncbi:MAG: endonuclease domain-containing protein [Bacteroidales bacterium]|nr:endonuclease domain-containing protein [Bacteroidales bacterium]
MVFSKRIIESKQNLGASYNIKIKARELRKNLTGPEKILWSYIRKRQQKGMHFRRQHPYGIYILDFYCFEANLVIEVDGLIHLNQKEYDNERTRYLESSGLRVLRFRNQDIEERIEWVIEKINKNLSNNKLKS